MFDIDGVLPPVRPMVPMVRYGAQHRLLETVRAWVRIT
jgi:hypothetical protein